MSARLLTYVLLAAVGLVLAIVLVNFLDSTITELIEPAKGALGS